MRITLAKPTDTRAISDEIERHLLESLAAINAQSTNMSFVLEAENALGERIGGLVASSSYGWLLVKMLWVRDDQRGAGCGRQLMAAAEAKGREMQCHSAWLDTSNASAREFYLKLGYRDFGVLQNGPGRAPEEHARWFMKRDLLAD
jgi:GNAT superfamily N-acetyltransferase